MTSAQDFLRKDAFVYSVLVGVLLFAIISSGFNLSVTGGSACLLLFAVYMRWEGRKFDKSLVQENKKAQEDLQNFVWGNSNRIVDVTIRRRMVFLGEFSLDGTQQTLLSYNGVIYKPVGDS